MELCERGGERWRCVRGGGKMEVCARAAREVEVCDRAGREVEMFGVRAVRDGTPAG